MSIILTLIIFALLAIAIYFIYRSVQDQSLMTFYEKQGASIYPGSRRPFIGSIPEFLAYQKVRHSDQVVEVDIKWLINNQGIFTGKKNDEPQQWQEMVIFYHLGEMEIFVSDPSVVIDLAKMVDRKLINKNSFFKNYLLSTRL